MKKQLLLLICFIVFSSMAFATRRHIVVHNGGVVDDRIDIPVPADEPDVYYDSETQEIIIDGMGFVSYYDVEITSMSTSATVLTTQVGGSYDTIDISSLAADDYLITIDTPLGNTYEGYFDTY